MLWNGEKLISKWVTTNMHDPARSMPILPGRNPELVAKGEAILRSYLYEAGLKSEKRPKKLSLVFAAQAVLNLSTHLYNEIKNKTSPLLTPEEIERLQATILAFNLESTNSPIDLVSSSPELSKNDLIEINNQ